MMRYIIRFNPYVKDFNINIIIKDIIRLIKN